MVPVSTMLQNNSAPGAADGEPDAPRPRRGRRVRTPVEVSRPARGSAPARRQEERRDASTGETGGGAVRPAAAAATALALPASPDGGLRDIGELTFGPPPPAPTQPGATKSTAANQAQRAKAPAPTQPPWRKVCDLVITAADGTEHSGTGWFISPRTLVTAGHCIFVFSPGSPTHGIVRSILVMPARDGEMSADESPFGWAEAPRENLRVHPNWVNNRDIGFDYGAIILLPEAPLGQQVGFFGYGHFLDQDLNGSEPTLTGYPDNVAEDGTQWFERNRIRQVTETRVRYDIFTATGQSGSPVFFRSNNIACAIHTLGESPFNSGVRINASVVAQLDEWKV